MYFKTIGSMKSGTGLQVNHTCMSAGDGGRLVAGRAQSLHSESQRDTQRLLAFADISAMCVHMESGGESGCVGRSLLIAQRI